MVAIVILTGAGISAESGLATFRASDGLWEGHDVMAVATPEGFAADPGLVHAFYNARRAAAAAAAPNAAHKAIAQLAADPRHHVSLVTQNVDGLHEAGGSGHVIHMHGAVDRALCAACGHRWAAPMVMHPADPCPDCGRAATRPDIVWFGEIPHHMDRIADALTTCDLFVSIGTSGNVYPAAGFVRAAAEAGAHTLELNLDASAGASAFDERRQGMATKLVPAWVAEMLRR